MDLLEKEFLSMMETLAHDIDVDEYQRLCTIRMIPNDLGTILSLDPFSADYRAQVVALYHRVAQCHTYDPVEQEKSGIGYVPDPWRSSSPFSFRSTKFVSEFLAAWSAIFNALDLSSGQSVLEYGPGSGQALLLLARTGVRAFGVDIDEDSLELIRVQNEKMGLDVSLERAEFGAGFDGQRFDRVLFFESFHHSLRFDRLLIQLHERVEPTGKLIFCGEPIVPSVDSAVPFAWGPRMDALSLLCIQRNGWMELGFQKEFFVRCLMRCGWMVRHRPNPVFRAECYIAEPIRESVAVASDILLGATWDIGEGTHRWSIAETATIDLPIYRWQSLDIAARLANYLQEPKKVTVKADTYFHELWISPGGKADIKITGIRSHELQISTTLTLVQGDKRALGIAIEQLTVSGNSG